MGSASNNLVIVKGETENIIKFKQIAYKTDSKAFNFDNLLPFPGYYNDVKEKSAYSHLIYGNKWGSGFSVLARETDNTLVYFFNSKYSIANLEFVAQKFSDLELIHIGITTDEDYLRWDYYKFKNGLQLYNHRISKKDFDFKIVSELYSYEYIAELYFKFESLINLGFFIKEPCIYNEFYFDKENHTISFFELFHRFKYLRENSDLYDGILFDVENLNKQDLQWAKDIGYPFRTNGLQEQLDFINNNYINEKKEKHLDKLISEINLNNICKNELLNAANYCFMNLDRNSFFRKIIQHVIKKLTNDIVDFNNKVHEYKVMLADYPGVVPKYSFDNMILNNVSCLDKYDEFKSEIDIFNDKLNKLKNTKSDFDIKFSKNINSISESIEISNDERKLKLINYIEEAIEYMDMCNTSMNRLKEKNSINNYHGQFSFMTDTSLTDTEFIKIVTKYDLSDIFPQFKEDELSDLPF